MVLSGTLLVGQIVSCGAMLWTMFLTSKGGRVYNARFASPFAILVFGTALLHQVATVRAMPGVASEVKPPVDGACDQNGHTGYKYADATHPTCFLHGMARQPAGDGTGGAGCRVMCDADPACDGFAVRSDEECHTYTKPLAPSWVDDEDVVAYAACAGGSGASDSLSPPPPPSAPPKPTAATVITATTPKPTHADLEKPPPPTPSSSPPIPIGSATEGGVRQLQTTFSPMTDSTIRAAVAECMAESEAFNCPTSAATYGPIAEWETEGVTDMNSLFRDCSEFNGDISRWVTPSVTTMYAMFHGATSFNGDLGGLDTSSVTTMTQMFYGATSFNGDLSGFDTSSVTSMYQMFKGASSFNGDLSGFDTSSVRTMLGMFHGATSFNGDLSGFDTSSVISMHYMFYQASSFNGDLSGFDTSSVTTMYGMFYVASSFNGDLSGFDTSSVTTMATMFNLATSFNGDLSGFNTSSVTTMAYMFKGARSFNGDLSGLDTSSVTTMANMFQLASSFNGDLSGFNTSSVTTMAYMFKGAISFNGDLSGFDTSSVTSTVNAYGASGMTDIFGNDWDPGMNSGMTAQLCPLWAQSQPQCTCEQCGAGCAGAACDDGVGDVSPTWMRSDVCAEGTAGLACAGTTCVPQGGACAVDEPSTCLTVGDTTKLACATAAGGHHLVGVYAEPATWTAAACPTGLAECDCATAWVAECDATFSAPCGFEQDRGASSAGVTFCADVAPPVPTCATSRVEFPLNDPTVALSSLLLAVDDNSAHFAGQPAAFKVSVSEPTSAPGRRLPFFTGIASRKWHGVDEWLRTTNRLVPPIAGSTVQFSAMGGTRVTISSVPARADRVIVVNVTDRSGNSALCTATAYVLAPILTPSTPSIAMTTLATSSTEVHELELTNTGDGILTINTAGVVVATAGDPVPWAVVRFASINREVVLGSADPPHTFSVEPGASIRAHVQFLGVESPGVGEHNATLRIRTNDPYAPVTEVALRFTVDHFALVIVGLPKTVEVTMAPGEMSEHTIVVYNVYSSGLTFNHTGCTCSHPIPGASLPCRLNSTEPQVAVDACSHDLRLGGDVRYPVELIAPTAAGLYEFEWRMHPTSPAGLPQFWDVTAIVAVVADPARFDPERTTLTLVTTPVATEIFDILATVRDVYGNEITASGAPQFDLNLSAACGSTDLFSSSYDDVAGYGVRDVTATCNGTHTVEGLASSDGVATMLLEASVFEVSPLPCSPPVSVPNAEGNRCLLSYCERGAELTAERTSCQQCGYGFFSDDGDNHGLECQPCGAGSICTSFGCIVCEECSSGRVGQGTECVACSPGRQPSDDRVSCMSCPTGTAGAGGECSQCVDGSEPASNLQSCQPCPAGSAGTGGTCSQSCRAGTAPNTARTLCGGCGVGEASTGGQSCSVCGAGYEPDATAASCIPCRTGSAGIGGECSQCGAGMAPITGRTSCEMCAAGTAGDSGVCMQCDDGSKPDANSITCVPCPAGSAGTDGVCNIDCAPGAQPNTNRTECKCSPNYYNSTRGALGGGIKCYATGYTGPAAPVEVCQSCADLECIESCEGDVVILGGWSVLRQSDSSISVFACLNEDSCPSKISSTEFDSWALPSHDPASCAIGYTGLLCGECAKKGQHNQEGYEMKPDGSCKDCSEFNVWGVVVMIVVAFVIIYLAMHVKAWFNQVGVITALLEGLGELKPIAKIVIATMQIVTGFSGQLNLTFPASYAKFLQDFGQYFRFDITFVVSVGCASDGSYVSTLILNIMVVVLVVIAVLLFFKGSVAKMQRKNKTATDDEKMEAAKTAFGKFDKDGQGINKDEMMAMCNKIDKSITKKQINQLFDAADKDGGGIIDFNEFWAALQGDDTSSEQIDLSGLVSASERNALAADAFGRVALLAFLLYPGLTTKIFDAFVCRELGPDHAVLAVDYSIDCGSTRYASIHAIAIVLMILWPFGLPALLLLKLWKARKDIFAEDEDTVAQFDFVLGDYKKEFCASLTL